MKKYIKSFTEFLNENYNNSGAIPAPEGSMKFMVWDAEMSWMDDNISYADNWLKYNLYWQGTETRGHDEMDVVAGTQGDFNNWIQQTQGMHAEDFDCYEIMDIESSVASRPWAKYHEPAPKGSLTFQITNAREDWLDDKVRVRYMDDWIKYNLYFLGIKLEGDNKVTRVKGFQKDFDNWLQQTQDPGFSDYVILKEINPSLN